MACQQAGAKTSSKNVNSIDFLRNNMPEEKNKKQEFLDKFTEEMIMNTVKDIKDRKKFESDLERVKKAIAVEKLKIKFEGYGEKPAEKKEEEKPAQKPEEKGFLPAIPQASAQPAPAKPKELPMTKIALPPKLPPTPPGEINFGKILPLVKDPAVTYIECPGVEKNVIIKRAGVTTKTQIILAKEEILTTIKSFSEKARIPLIEGMLNARVDNLEISAVVTETGSPSFIIRKILVEVTSAKPSMLQGPVLPQPAAPRPAFPRPMPPVTRPFTPGQIPGQAPGK